MTLGEWMKLHDLSTGNLAVRLKVSKDTVRKWLAGRTPAQKYRDILFDMSKGRVTWKVDYFEDHPDTVTDRRGFSDVRSS